MQSEKDPAVELGKACVRLAFKSGRQW